MRSNQDEPIDRKPRGKVAFDLVDEYLIASRLALLD
jgi:hypothetical protein